MTEQVDELVSAACELASVRWIDGRHPSVRRLRAALQSFNAAASYPSTPTPDGVPTPAGSGTYTDPDGGVRDRSSACTPGEQPSGSASSTDGVRTGEAALRDVGAGAVGGPRVSPLMLLARDIDARFDAIDKRIGALADRVNHIWSTVRDDASIEGEQLETVIDD